MRNNRGFTIVEILIAIAIIAIMMGMAGIGLSLANSRDTDQGARTIEQALGNARLDAMSKTGTFEVTIDRVSNEVSINRPSGVSTLKLPGRTAVTFEPNTSFVTAGDDPEQIRVVFDKSTGRVQSVSTVETVGDPPVKVEIGGKPPAVLRIEIFNQNRSKVAQVLLIASTGKYFIRYGGNI
jgi:prepilin-type N-terminal cleavage/methylation domain-containing protein